MTTNRQNLSDLILLAALWGASFLFMRLTAPAFGPIAMAALRVAGAALVLLPLLAQRRQLPLLARHAVPLLVVGIANSALPFALFGFAALHLAGGLSAIFNAATPLFGAAIAWLWLGQRLAGWRLAGLAIGFSGVAALARAKAGDAAAGGPAWAVAACLLAPVLYGFSANYTRRALADVPPLVVATGSQLGATVVLAAPAAWLWPAEMPGPQAWAALAGLAVLCTGLAYVLYFRLIAHAGAGYAMAVTYLVPAFAVVWGGLLLAEPVTMAMLSGCAVILLGTALATGLLPRRR
ncbi:MAG: DMT family transporter [Aquabacterium sp.]